MNIFKIFLISTLFIIFSILNCFSMTIEELHGLYILKSVTKEVPSAGTWLQVIPKEPAGYGYFTLNKRFRIRIKYEGDINLNRDEIGSFTLDNDQITMTIDSTGKVKTSTISLSGNILTVITDFTDEPEKNYILTLELEKKNNIMNQATLNIKNGWNLLTVSNFIKPISEFYTISESINTIWKWDRENQTWKLWSPDENIQKIISGYNISTIKELLAGEGFWVNAKNSTTLNIDNFFSIKTEMLFILKSGWNLCGVLQNLSPSSLPESSGIKTVWQWDINNKKWKIWSPLSSIKQIISQYKIDEIITINQFEGFWINK